MPLSDTPLEDQSPGVALLDPFSLIASDRAIEGADQVSFPEDLIELFNLLEALCLREKLLVPAFSPPPATLPDTALCQRLSDSSEALMPVALLDENFLKRMPEIYARTLLIPEVRKAQRQPEVWFDFNPMAGGKYFYDSRTGDWLLTPEYQSHIEYFSPIETGILAEEYFNLPLIPSVRHASHYIQSLGLQTTARLFTEWVDLYYRMKSGLEESKKARRGLFIEIEIPPIAYALLSTCSDRREIVTRALELRSALAPVRLEYRELWEAQTNPNVSDKEYYSKQRKLKTVADKLIRKVVPNSDQAPDLLVGGAAKDLIGVVGSDKAKDWLGGLNQDEISIKGLLNVITKYPLTWSWDRFQTRKFRTLFRVGRRFSDSKDYNRIVFKLWGRSLNELEQQRAKNYASGSDLLLKGTNLMGDQSKD